MFKNDSHRVAGEGENVLLCDDKVDPRFRNLSSMTLQLSRCGGGMLYRLMLEEEKEEAQSVRSVPVVDQGTQRTLALLGRVVGHCTYSWQ